MEEAQIKVIKDYFFLSFKSLLNRRVRSWLTMIGIFIGIAAVVALISVGQGMKAAIDEQFMKMGTDKITITPGSGFLSMSPGSTNILSRHDMDLIERVSGVKMVSGMLMKTAQVESNNLAVYTYITCIPQDETKQMIADMQSYEIAQGRDLKKEDKYKAVIGKSIADGTVFERKLKVGDGIKISGTDFRVVGIMAPIGSPPDDSSLLIPLDTGREIFSEPDKIDYIFVQVLEGQDPKYVAEKIKEKMRQDRGQKKGEEDFSVQTTEQLMDSFNVILNVVQAVLIGIAAISLLVGGVGITNTMYTSVMERTKEIGIMKSIGAENKEILLLFIIESGLLGMAGGAIGIMLGIGISKLVEIIAAQALGTALLKSVFPWYLIAGSLIFSYLVGTLAGVLPAMQAASMKPVDALRK